MTYLEFHAWFIVPPLIALAGPAAVHARQLGTRRIVALLAVPVLAVLYTTPWDNYLVKSGIWTYGTDRVIAVVGYVPIEEYGFFVLQPLLAGALFYWLLGRQVACEIAGATPASTPRPIRWQVAGTGVLLAAGGTGFALLGWEPGRYLGLILAWAAPMLAAIWWFASPYVLPYRRPATATVLLATAWLCLADGVAVRQGIWDIAEATTVGVELAGLPVEEAVFFLVTNLMVVLGVMLFLGPGMARFRS